MATCVQLPAHGLWHAALLPILALLLVLSYLHHNVASWCLTLWLAYFAGGTVIYSRCSSSLASAIAGALRGQFHSAQQRRSRLAEHLLGPALHRTHPAAAAICYWCLQYSSLYARGLISNASLLL